MTEPQRDPIPSLLPPLEEALTATEAYRRFEESFDPEGPADLVVEGVPPHPPGRSWAYDFVRRRFVSAPQQHGPLETHGIETLKQWIEKCLLTARGAHPIYSEDYGIELPNDLVGVSADTFPDAIYESRISEGLLAHERITSIEDFAAVYDPMEEFVLVSFTCVLDDGTRFPVQNVAVLPV